MKILIHLEELVRLRTVKFVSVVLAKRYEMGVYKVILLQQDKETFICRLVQNLDKE